MSLSDAKNLEKVYEVGRYLRCFHEASKRFENDYPDVIIDNNMLDPRLEPVENWFRALKSDEVINDDNFGITHSDFHDLNFFFGTDGKIGTFDFDTAEKQFLLYDLACCLMSFFL